MNTRMRYIVGAVLLAVSVSCRTPAEPSLVGGLPADALQAVVGTWSLASWNGDAVPSFYETHYKPAGPGDPIVIDYHVDFTGGSIQFTDAGQYTRATNRQKRFASGATEALASTNEAGSFTGSVSGGSITLNLGGPIQMTGTISNNTMTLRHVVGTGQPLGDVWVYTK